MQMMMFGHSKEFNAGDQEFNQKPSAWFIDFLLLGSCVHIIITWILQYLSEKSIFTVTIFCKATSNTFGCVFCSENVPKTTLHYVSEAYRGLPAQSY
jgi:hypothetical protein